MLRFEEVIVIDFNPIVVFQDLLLEILANMRKVFVSYALVDPWVKLVLFLVLFFKQILIQLFKSGGVLLDVEGITVFYELSAFEKREVSSLMQIFSEWPHNMSDSHQTDEAVFVR